MNSKIVYQDQGCIVKGVYYSVDDLKNLYITQNIPQAELAEKFGVSRTAIINLVKRFGLFKDPDVVKANRKQAIMDKYGVESVMHVPEFAKRSQDVIMEKYGAKSPLVNESVAKKTAATMFERYGVRFPSQSKEIVQKKKDNYYKANGVYAHFQKEIDHFDVWSDPDGLKAFLGSFSEKPTYAELAVYFNVDRTAINAKVLSLGLQDYVNVRPGFSSYESEIISFLVDDLGIDANEIQHNVVGLLPARREIDIYAPNYNIGIEFNGDYWHSDVFNTDHGGRSTYHQEKSLEAEKVGIFLFHIFEYEWNDDKKRAGIQNRLRVLFSKNLYKIAARKCSVATISRDEKKRFLEENHIQGNDRSTIYYGLFYGEEIVACMTFVHPKNKKYTWELSRFCCKSGYTIQGGASKLFKAFVDTLSDGDTISSYNDITKTKGDLYSILGFELKSVNEPNYVWINCKTKDIRTRYQEQKAGEADRMHSAGYHRLCDCGTKTWVYTVGGKRRYD